MKTRFIGIALFAALLASGCSTLGKTGLSETKRMELIEDSINHQAAVSALKNMDFVLEADRLIFKRGKSAYVQPLTNFISARNGQVSVQVSPFYGGGPNGVGGVTVNGRPSNVQIKEAKDGKVIGSMGVMGNGISATMQIEINKSSNRARAVISPNFNSQSITLEGILVPSGESNTYSGMPY